MFYIETRSEFDGKPLVVIFTNIPGKNNSVNAKTGAVMQTWILRRDIDPATAVRTAVDGSICGDCPRRHSTGGDCYVIPFQAPLSVYRAYKRGSYARLDLRNPEHVKVLKGHPIRLGSYGDPVAVPVEIWKNYFRACQPAYHTGYTHSWGLEHAQEYRKFLMASVDSPLEAFVAHAMEWRTFRVRDGAADPLDPGAEIVCPASEEAGFKKTCETCGACDGVGAGAQRRSIAIVAHGQRSQTRLRRAATPPLAGTARTFGA